MIRWNWYVKRKGKHISIIDYLKNQKKWHNLISETLMKIDKLEDEK